MYRRITTALIAVALLAEMRTPDVSANPPTRYQRYAEVLSRGPRVVSGKRPSSSKPRQLGQPLRPVTPITPTVPKPQKPSKRPVKKAAINATVLSNRAGLAGVRIIFKNTRTRNMGQRVTGVRGTISAFYVPVGNVYQITPSKPDYVFTPASYSITATGPRTLRFEAKRVVRIVGQQPGPGDERPVASKVAINAAVLSNRAGLAGVRIVFRNTRTNSTGYRVTGAKGTVSPFYVPPGSSYEITPSKAGYVFTPASYKMMATGPRTIRFEAKKVPTGGGKPIVSKVAINAAVLSNRAGLAGVRIVFRNTRTNSTGYRVTGAKGTASLFYVPRGKSYEITPSKTGYAFLPPSYKMTATGPRSIRFEAKKVSPAPAQPQKAPIAVYVLDENGRGLRGAKVVFKNSQTGTTGERYADSSGKCSDFWGYFEAKYLVTADKAGCQFDPPSISVNLQRSKLTLYFAKKREQTKLIVNVLSGREPVVGVRVDFKNIATGNTGWRNTLRTGRCQDFWVPVGNDYSITPRSDDYVFTPRTKTASIRNMASQTVTFEARRKSQDNGEPNIGSSSHGLESDSAPYQIRVKTADLKRAGTDSKITIRLRGTAGRTAEVSLDEKDRDDHEKGHEYDFDPEMPNVGDLREMWVKSDGYHPISELRWELLPPHLAGGEPKGGDSKWFPLGFEVEHKTTSERWYFPCYRWIRWNDGLPYNLKGYRWEDTVEYEIKVDTAAVEYAGTDADVYLEIFDPPSNPLPKVLLDNRAENFEAGSNDDTDTFTCRLPKVEDIGWINLTHNDRGAHADWFVGSVEITRTDNRQSWVFIGNQWIAKSIEDHTGKGASLWLEAKDPEETANYKIEVLTSSEDGAGTDAKVYLQIWNGQTALPWIQLDDEDNNFEKGKHDEFNYRMLRIDSITKIVLRHDNSGNYPPWLPEKVEIKRQGGWGTYVPYSFSNPDEKWATAPPGQGAQVELWRTVPQTPVTSSQ